MYASNQINNIGTCYQVFRCVSGTPENLITCPSIVNLVRCIHFEICNSSVIGMMGILNFSIAIVLSSSQFGSKLAIFVPCDLEIWWTTLENNRAPLLHYINLCASFQIHRWIQTWVTARKRPIRVKIGNLSRVTLTFDGWPWKMIRYLFYTTLSFCASFHCHRWIQTGVTARKKLNSGQNRQFFVPCEIWRMTLKNNRAPLLWYSKLCGSFHSQWWFQTGVTVRKRLHGVMTSVTLTFGLWHRPFAWTSLLSMVITPENFMMIRWEEHSEKGVTDRHTYRQTDRQTDIDIQTDRRTGRRTDRQTDGRTDGRKEVYIGLLGRNIKYRSHSWTRPCSFVTKI